MAPGHITFKWCKDALESITLLRRFLIDGLRAAGFLKVLMGEIFGVADGSVACEGVRGSGPLYRARWQAARQRIRRVAPLDVIGRYMPHWFDYAIGDEAHQMANDPAQGNGL